MSELRISSTFDEFETPLQSHPEWHGLGGVYLDDVVKGLKIEILQRDQDGNAVPYMRGEIVSDGVLDVQHDDMLWVDMRIDQAIFKLPDSEPLIRHICLGIIGVTPNDNGEWNPFIYTRHWSGNGQPIR